VLEFEDGQRAELRLGSDGQGGLQAGASVFSRVSPGEALAERDLLEAKRLARTVWAAAADMDDWSSMEVASASELEGALQSTLLWAACRAHLEGLESKEFAHRQLELGSKATRAAKEKPFGQFGQFGGASSGPGQGRLDAGSVCVEELELNAATPVSASVGLLLRKCIASAAEAAAAAAGGA